MTIFDDIKHAGEGAVHAGEKGFDGLAGLAGEHLPEKVKKTLEELTRKVHDLKREIQLDALRAERIAKGFARHVQDDIEFANKVADKVEKEGKAIAALAQSIGELAEHWPKEVLSTAEQYQQTLEPVLSKALSPQSVEELFRAILPASKEPTSDHRSKLKSTCSSLIAHINDLARLAPIELPFNMSWLQQTFAAALEALPDESVGRVAALIGDHLDMVLSRLASLRPSESQPVPGALTAAKEDTPSDLSEGYTATIWTRQSVLGVAAYLDAVNAAVPLRVSVSWGVQVTPLSIGSLTFGLLSMVIRLGVVVVDALIATDVIAGHDVRG